MVGAPVDRAPACLIITSASKQRAVIATHGADGARLVLAATTGAMSSSRGHDVEILQAWQVAGHNAVAPNQRDLVARWRSAGRELG